ncbi:MAG: RloB domain-containing protein [Magnetococcales bacterium]|nr:RloB domain-containing protein [Magnetococcales bacterium]
MTDGNAFLPSQSGSRLLQQRLLIVTKDYEYFKNLRDSLGISPRQVGVRNIASREAFNVVKEANRPPHSDPVYCLFDGDKWLQGNQHGIKMAQKEIETNGYIGVPSTPCFEVWILWHFQDIPAESLTPDISGAYCPSVISQLLGCLPNYNPGSENLYSQLSDKEDNALQRAHLPANAGACSFANPSTKVHELVEKLRQMARK